MSPTDPRAIGAFAVVALVLAGLVVYLSALGPDADPPARPPGSRAVSSGRAPSASARTPRSAPAREVAPADLAPEGEPANAQPSMPQVVGVPRANAPTMEPMFGGSTGATPSGSPIVAPGATTDRTRWPVATSLWPGTALDDSGASSLTGNLLDWDGQPVPQGTLTGCGTETVTDDLGAYTMDVSQTACEVLPYAILDGVGVKGLTVIAHPVAGTDTPLDIVVRPDGFVVWGPDQTCVTSASNNYATATVTSASGGATTVPLLATAPDAADGDAVFAAVNAACRAALGVR